ncbi:hypothetical protein A3C23_04030 [Candidatus Roizmanbacteria bacterium RIFCSPHIGHO2_02_FULL_37_13b]|uniref:Uncharacterized protein n=1 Tax=Candidatus Roizmanbacteria bacterium RIFCSPLOWO2_02_FULL_36_11 TaxID=1802071 RepID=A0A1F7JH40_9BACT|nr:MAG: hypothetical protein A3C23_04030 [Candidatus Roizmanbacteria bacterium RIFCSPHIGHO2_02_FULL_37_13b]OGK54886.1 MAG: hypothetical protein A3H78_00180 [Candidatus Roizmanbacteria bacterium RIFCSPLOWO2_02_FULL_36_11]
MLRRLIKKIILLVNKNSITFVITIGLSLIALNYALSFLTVRIDLSQGRAYSLSNSTKKLVKALDNKVTIKLFITSDLPAALGPLKTDVIDLVNEFKRVNRSKISVQYADPKKNTKDQDEAKKYNIPELQFSQIEKDKYAVSSSYFGIVISYKDKNELIPQATNVDSLEYDIASSIYKMSRKEDVKIGLIGFPQVLDPRQDDFYTLKSVLERQFILEPIEATDSGQQRIDSSFQALIVVDSDNHKFNDDQVAVLEKYIENGGQALIMVDGIYVSDDLTTQKANNNLFNLFKYFGLELNQDLILSKTAEVANFSTGQVGFFTVYPFWLKTDNFDEKSSELSSVSALTFPWTSSVKINNGSQFTTRILVKTTKNSWTVQGENIDVSPNSIKPPSENQVKEQNLITVSQSKKDGHVILIPSSRFIKEQFLAQGRGNVNLILNILNNYASKGALSGIRSRSVSINPLVDINDNQKDKVKYLAMLLLPIIFCLYGANRLLKRR